ncbi:MAG: hypothetical protein ACHQQQ_15245 [Bacteroidota bacterium]
MIDKILLRAIKSKKNGITIQAIYQGINRVRKEFYNSISKEDGAYIYGSRIGIDIFKFLKNNTDQQDRIQKFLSSGKSEDGGRIQKIKQPKSSPIKILKVKDTTIEDTLLPGKITEDAKKMAEIYPFIYIFENSVRNFVRMAMDKAFPTGWWNENRITTDVFKKAVQRKGIEGKNLWHGSRSDNMLDYIDFDELEKVISKNTETLTPYFKGLPSRLLKNA